MSGSIYLELGPIAAGRLRRLMESQNETDPSRMVARALALLEAAAPFLTDEARLRVLRPESVLEGDAGANVVEFQFTKQAGQGATTSVTQ